ncbi:MAG: hypothetical protein JO023_23860 [Chloroflexi bacterium]|nr:hypothetical protein [Chloroflexota bacterium]
MLVGKLRHIVDEAVVQRTKRGRRGDAMAQVVTQERAQLAARLQSADVAIAVQAIDTRAGQRDVIGEYGGDVGAGHHRRLPIGMVEHADGATPTRITHSSV